MTPLARILSLGIAAALLLALPSRAEEPLADARLEESVKAVLRAHPEIVADVLRDVLAQRPEILQQAIADLLKSRTKTTEATARDPQSRALIEANAATLFGSPHQVDYGPADASVTLVEFFDYNCGYCRRSHLDKYTLMAEDHGLRVVLKELPVLGPGSVEAARVAIAVRMQDNPARDLYRSFNRRMMSVRGRADGQTARTHAAAVGVDMARLEVDLQSEEITATLDETRRLANALKISATPTYVVQSEIVVGAVGLDRLKARIDAARHAP